MNDRTNDATGINRSRANLPGIFLKLISSLNLSLSCGEEGTVCFSSWFQLIFLLLSSLLLSFRNLIIALVINVADK